jgi:hypothetical protein
VVIQLEMSMVSRNLMSLCLVPVALPSLSPGVHLGIKVNIGVPFFFAIALL